MTGLSLLSLLRLAFDLAETLGSSQLALLLRNHFLLLLFRFFRFLEGILSGLGLLELLGFGSSSFGGGRGLFLGLLFLFSLLLLSQYLLLFRNDLAFLIQQYLAFGSVGLQSFNELLRLFENFL